MVDNKSDEQLLAEHLAGGSQAFDALVARYVHEVYGFLCRFVGNSTAAEDLTQEAFVQVHLAAHSFDPQRVFRPWLYTIAANKARDFLRSRGRRQEYSLDSSIGGDDGPSQAQSLESDDAPLSESVERDEQKRAVRAVVDRMPDNLRLILVLGYFQQLPYAKIAEILEIPVGTVKSRLHAAVNHFAGQWRAHVAASSTAEG